MRPQSSTATRRSRRTCPVSRSTSTTATWAPNGNVAPSWRKSYSATSGSPSVAARRATSDHASACAGTPATPMRPSSVTTMSSGCASSIVGGDVARPFEHRGRGVRHRSAAELQRTRPAGTAAARDVRGVGLHEADALHRDAETVGDDHRERRRMPLPVRRRADADRRAAVVVDRDRRVLGAGTARGHLDIRARRRYRVGQRSPRSRRSACSARSSSYPARRTASRSASA